ncbi:hypothetical protein B0J14DRAFT_658417 [Halenospora varia]|nr:hypothetical protein B0J14DRAFT_658417 [Halenospora varia]
MPMNTRDKRGKRTREISEEVEEVEEAKEAEEVEEVEEAEEPEDVDEVEVPDTQLGQESSYADLKLKPNASSALPSQGPSKRQTRLSTPPPPSTLSRVPNVKYFREQEIFVENLGDLGPLLNWDLIQGTTMKWLSYDDPAEEYNDTNPHMKFGMILLGELGAFLNLQAAKNHFTPEKPEFSIQLVVEDSTLDVLKDLLSRRGEGYAINNPLRIKVPESELLSDSFNCGDPFPDGFDGTSTTDTDDGSALAASAFTAGDKVAVQVWFGSYNFKNRTGPTFRLLKLWKLQQSLSGSPNQRRDLITPRKRRR